MPANRLVFEIGELMCPDSRLRYLRDANSHKYGVRRVVMSCICGSLHTADLHNVASSGKTKSCGCQAKEKLIARNIERGKSNAANARLY